MFRSLVLVAVFSIFLGGCSLFKIDFQGNSLEEVFQNDVEFAADLLVRYGDANEVKCGTWLKGILTSNMGLKAEVAKGLISGGTKLYLLQKYVNANKTAFSENCGAVASAIIIQAGSSRGIGF